VSNSNVTSTEILKGLAKAEAGKFANQKFVDLKRQADAKLEEKSPASKAVLDAVGPPAAALIALTAKEMANDPDTIRKVAELSRHLGKNGFSKAVKSVGVDASKAFAKAAGVEAMNPVAVAKVLDALPATAAKISPKIGKTVAKQCATIQTKLGIKVAAKTGATAGKAAPFLGNAIAVASTGLAAASLFKAVGTKDAEKICKEGCNTLLQAVGIAFPWVALGGDLIDLGWTAKIATQKGEDPKASPSQAQTSGQLISIAAKAACEEASKAGDNALAKALAEFSAATQDVSNKKQVEKSGQDALRQLAQSASTEFSKQAKLLPEGPEKEKSEILAQSFGELFKIILHQQKSPKLADEKRNQYADDLAKLLKVAAE